MTGIDDEVKGFVKQLNEDQLQGKVVNGVNGTHDRGVDDTAGEVKTEDQNVPEGLVGLANGAEGKTKWGVGKLHQVHLL